MYHLLSNISLLGESQRCMMSRYRLPYLDHPYAADLPSCFEEQDSDDFDTAPDLLGAFVDIEDVTYCENFEVEDSTLLKSSNYNSNNSSSSNNNNKNKKKSNTSKKERVADEYVGSVTRCICDFQHDDGFMISCDRCCVWQHVDCMALDRLNIPETYLCELCQPRSFDKRRAVKLQLKKKEEMDLSEESSDNDDDDDDDGDDDEDDERTHKESLGRGKKRKASHNNAIDNDDDDFTTTSSSVGKNKRKRKSASDDKVESITENVYLKPYCRKRPRLDSGTDSRFSRSETTTTSTNKTVAAVDDRRHSSNSCGDDYDNDDKVMQRNICTDRVSQLLSSKGRFFEATLSTTTVGDSRLHFYEEQIKKRKFSVFQVEPSVKGIVATELIRSGHAVTEYTGIVTTKEEYEKSSSFDPTYLSVLCCTLEDGSKICIDARQKMNSYAKYIRPSCLPNTKVEYVSDRNGIRFFICATKNISAGKEITLPFLFNYKNCSGKVACPCKRSNCAIAKFYKSNNNNSYNKSGRLQAAKLLLKSTSNTLPGYASRVPTDASTKEFNQQQQLIFRDYDRPTVNSSGSSRDANHMSAAASDQLFNAANTAGFDALDSSKDSFDSSDELGPLVIAEFPISRKKSLHSRGNGSRFKPENDEHFFV